MSFANPQMRQIKFINMCVARSVAIVANLTLAWLVAKHTKKVLQPYKRILAITIFMDLAVSITVLAFQTTAITVNGIYYNLIDEISLGYFLPFYATLFGTTTVTFFVYAAVSIIPLHYIYRYMAVCHNQKLNFCQLGLLCIFCSIFPLWMFYFRTTRLWPDDRYDYYLNILYTTNEWLFFNGKPPKFIAVPSSKYSQPAIIPGIFYIITYAIIIYCSICVVYRLKVLQMSMSSKTLQLQKQMNKILFVQAAIPFITNVIPMILNNLSQWLQTSLFPQSDLPVWFLTVWSSAINPICTILLMSSYRKVIFNIFGSTSVPSKVSVIPRQTIINAISR